MRERLSVTGILIVNYWDIHIYNRNMFLIYKFRNNLYKYNSYSLRLQDISKIWPFLSKITAIVLSQFTVIFHLYSYNNFPFCYFWVYFFYPHWPWSMIFSFQEFFSGRFPLSEILSLCYISHLCSLLLSLNSHFTFLVSFPWTPFTKCKQLLAPRCL